MIVEDGAETTLMNALAEVYVAAVGDSSLRVVDESGKNHGQVD